MKTISTFVTLNFPADVLIQCLPEKEEFRFTTARGTPAGTTITRQALLLIWDNFVLTNKD